MSDRCITCYRPVTADSVPCPCGCGRQVCPHHGAAPDAVAILGELVDWFGPPDWTGPQVPEALAKRIATALAGGGGRAAGDPRPVPP